MKIWTLRDLLDMPRKPRPRRGVERIELSSDPVNMHGEKLNEIWWRGSQWAVTTFGVEALDGTYFIEESRLLEGFPRYGWAEHMAEKIWVNVDEFATAWLIAILLHGRAAEVDATALRKTFGKLPQGKGKQINDGDEA